MEAERAEAERAEAASRMCDDDDDTAALAGRPAGRCINGERREERRARPDPPAGRTDPDSDHSGAEWNDL